MSTPTDAATDLFVDIVEKFDEVVKCANTDCERDAAFSVRSNCKACGTTCPWHPMCTPHVEKIQAMLTVNPVVATLLGHGLCCKVCRKPVALEDFESRPL